MKGIVRYSIGILFLLFGIFLSIIQKEPHFYTFFSVGAFIILLEIYNSISEEKLFKGWKQKNFFIFFILLFVIFIIIDKLGIFLGYWTYQYTTILDEILKYVFEWVVAHLYIMLGFMIGIVFFQKKGCSFSKSVILSLVTFSTLIGLFTEYINSFSNSWEVLSMPITNYKIGNFFIIFQTIGYWLMAIIPFTIYKISNYSK